MRPSSHIIFQWYSVEWAAPPTRQLEVTPINRQSYMAEISSLLGLITDEDTREVLIKKMERMFDAAEDEQKLIHDIGSPTKVAVALIRYADNGVVTPEAAAVIDSVTDDEPEQEDDFDTLSSLDAQPELLIPESETEAPEAETETEPEPEAVDDETADYTDEAPEVEASEPVPEDEPVPDEAPEGPEAAAEDAETDAPLDLFEVFTGKKTGAPEDALPEDEPETPEVPAESAPEAAEPIDGSGFFSEAADLDAPAREALDAEAPTVEETDNFIEDEPLAPEVPETAEAEDEALPEIDAEAEAEALDAIEDEELFSDQMPELDAEEEDEPLTVTKVNTFLAILYFIIPGLVIGLPVFLVLLVLNLAFLAVAAAVLAAAVLLVLTGLTPLGLPDKLLCFGGAAAALAVGLVLLWFTIWFFLRVTCGWVRLMTRGGKRLSRKEVEIV